MSDHHSEDESRWIAKMRLRHALGDEYVCGLADVLRTLDERDEARDEVARREREHEALLETAQKALAHAEADAEKAESDLTDATARGDALSKWFAEVSLIVGEHVDDDSTLHAVRRVVRERDEARAHTSTAAFMRIERQLDEARAEVERLRTALRHLLLSRDSSWTGGHDWTDAVDDAIRALGIEVKE
jgi:chromosome segregation ATPase